MASMGEELDALDFHLGHVRKKLQAHEHLVGIETVRGRGYVRKRRNLADGASGA